MADDATYPPEPWHLRGRLLVSVLLVPAAQVPRLEDALPPGHRPVLLGGRVLLGVALAEYGPGGEVVYDELLTAVLTRPHGSLRAHGTIPRIWVSTGPALAGGRELWAIPKELCAVERHATASAVHADVTAEGEPVARLTARLGPRLLPGRLPLPLTTAQRGLTGRGAIVSANRVTAEVRTLRARWHFAPGGALAHLAGRRPLASVALTGADIVFGCHVCREQEVAP
ncbi:acetoacetate decarboxylase [Georgenia sp. 311]|uniref:acetoacetate decarboxylase family protein n=1 Tax=Georgenia sp. 311 TaxID=2585134 RepID=UPI0011125216|nr:acetoacetate decarboxylase family protein [Georgenia sp. 311]TNC18356.1 acetoacetate decarboxylase [Georgenia sp. 311]